MPAARTAVAVALWLLVAAVCWLPDAALAKQANHTCQNNNDCFGVPGRPVCVKPGCRDVNNPSVTGYCGECNPCTKKEQGWDEPLEDPLRSILLHGHVDGKDCYCAPDEYCSGAPYLSQTTTPNPKRGFCVKIDPDHDVLNRPCVAHIPDNELVLGVNDRSFCGLATYDVYSLKATYVEWRGVCWQRQCKFCSAAPLPGLPISLCPDGRSCLPEGVLGHAPLGSLSWAFWHDNPLIPMTGLVLLFAFLTLVSFLIYLLAWYVRHRRQEQSGYRVMHEE